MKAVDFYDTVWDTVIFGAGCSGFAAALALHRTGKRVLLIDRHASPVKECSWAFSTDTGQSENSLWREWLLRLEARGGLRSGRIDGAIAEILANEWLKNEKIAVLYHAVPVEVEMSSIDGLKSVVIGTKSGLHRLTSLEWIDATDTGELVTLSVENWQAPLAEQQIINITFRLGDNANSLPRAIPSLSGMPGSGQMYWDYGLWEGERILRIELPGDFDRPRRVWLPALQGLRASLTEAELKGALLSHGSVVPFFKYKLNSSKERLARNFVFLGGQGSTLAEKFTIGAESRIILQADCPCHDVAKQRLQIGCTNCTADVVVAGLGTGGAIAAIAAGRAAPGLRVCAFEAMPFSGGIGTGGGFHVYYFGVPGGLQEEVNRRVRDVMPLFGSAGQVGGFHPEAKKIVLDAMLAEAGVEVVYDAMLVDVEKPISGRMLSALFSTPGGPTRVIAKGWVDGTGDGDLAAGAGAQFRLGREGDGLLHAYSQSSGRIVVKAGVAHMQIPNYDAGYCDPTNEYDLTRARMNGVTQYSESRYAECSHPACMAPLAGIRQSRHFKTEYVLTLDDLISRRTFPDAVGYTGGHYDNHARDYEFETIEAAFWVWVCQQWYGRLACEIPWRMLLPRGLANVTLACRAVGVSEEAHHSFRMQRDIQRIGEAAGAGCALSVREKVACRDLPFSLLRACLVGTGAVRMEPVSELAAAFGGNVASPDFFKSEVSVSLRWLEEIKAGPATAALWHLYRSGDDQQVRLAVEGLLSSPDATISWRAASILAMWGNSRAEARLWEAIRNRENDQARDITRPQQEWFYVPRWYAALTILKRCITPASLPLLKELSREVSLVLNLRSAVALACEALLMRKRLSDDEKGEVEEILSALLLSKAPNSRRDPGWSTVVAAMPEQVNGSTVSEDYEWQLYLAIARARRALGLPMGKEVELFLSNDSRELVKRSFARVVGEGGF